MPGCQVDIRDISCEILYREETIVRCSKDASTGMWMKPLTRRIKEPMYGMQQNNKETNHIGGDSTATTSDSDWASSVRHRRKSTNGNYV